MKIKKSRISDQQLELVPIEYHLAYYPLFQETEWGPFQAFIDAVGASSAFPDYLKFSTNLPRLKVVRDLDTILKKEFYYVLAFDRGDGGFFLKVRPEACERAQLQLTPEDNKDMMKCFDVVTAAIETKANLKYEEDKKRNAV